MQEQGFPRPAPPVIGQYEEVFQEKRGQRKETRIRLEHDGVPDGEIIGDGKVHIKTGVPAEGVTEQSLTGVMIGRRKAFVIGQGVNKFQEMPPVSGNGFPDVVRFPGGFL